MIGRADIEGSNGNVAADAWLPQASYPCGNFSDTSTLTFEESKDLEAALARTLHVLNVRFKRAFALLLYTRFPFWSRPP